MARRRTLIVACCTLIGAACSSSGGAAPAPARFIVQRGWDGGVPMRADLHIHSRFSDGAHTVPSVVAAARDQGCDAIAITDHADIGLMAATPQYLAEIEAARAANPAMVILAGLEWNVPPEAGDEHATVLVPPGPQELTTLAEFKNRFDDFELDGRPKPEASAALEWLDQRGAAGLKPIVVYNHPSRKDATSLSNAADLERWREISDAVVAFEGAPGHQGSEPIGSYANGEQTVDRWDPMAARIGDAWDLSFQRNVDVHGALAGSDFHSEKPRLSDPWPCQFAETWLNVPDRSPTGLFRALRAGAFFGVHGRIARDVELTAQIAGVERPVRAGEHLRLPAPATFTVSLAFTVPDQDWRGEANQIDEVEFIVVTPEAASGVAKKVEGTGRLSVSHELVVGKLGVVVRARGRRIVHDGPDLMFYTNAIRISVGG
jgi:hypothetical protein